MPIQNTTKPISIRLTRPIDKRPKVQEHELHGTKFRYHKVNLSDKQMTLSIFIYPNLSPMDTYAVYVSYGSNETTLDMNFEDEDELRHTIFMPSNVHLGNGTYIFGVKLISKFFYYRAKIFRY